MNWKKILLGGLVLAVAATLVAFLGGIDLNLGGLSLFMPVAVVLILIVLVINTWYQIDILKELRSFKDQEND